jgi:hypothetical protein
MKEDDVMKKLKKKKKKNNVTKNLELIKEKIHKMEISQTKPITEEEVKELEIYADCLDKGLKQGAIFGFRCPLFDEMMSDIVNNIK